MTDKLIYLFGPGVKQLLIDNAEDSHLERVIAIPGPTPLTPTQAAYLMDRVRSIAPDISRQIAEHPDLKNRDRE